MLSATERLRMYVSVDTASCIDSRFYIVQQIVCRIGS